MVRGSNRAESLVLGLPKAQTNEHVECLSVEVDLLMVLTLLTSISGRTFSNIRVSETLAGTPCVFNVKTN